LNRRQFNRYPSKINYQKQTLKLNNAFFYHRFLFFLKFLFGFCWSNYNPKFGKIGKKYKKIKKSLRKTLVLRPPTLKIYRFAFLFFEKRCYSSAFVPFKKVRMDLHEREKVEL